MLQNRFKVCKYQRLTLSYIDEYIHLLNYVLVIIYLFIHLYIHPTNNECILFATYRAMNWRQEGHKD